MPSSWGRERGLVCVCGQTYDKLRTGITFTQARRDIISIGTKKDGTPKYGRRNGVLGYLHEQKLMLWDQHVAMCESVLGEATTNTRAGRSRMGGR